MRQKMSSLINEWTGEPRTTTDLIQDLLNFVERQEWSGQVSTGCHCHPEWHDACPECRAFETPPSHFRSEKVESRQHEPGCKLAALIQEAEAYLNAEEELRCLKEEQP